MFPKPDIRKMKSAIMGFPREWDGRKAILELKAADYNWRQMEWFGFYFEYLCVTRLHGLLQIPGDRFSFVRPNGRKTFVTFDMKGTINWDIKSKAIKTDDHRSILNDQEATDRSVREYGAHGLVIALS